MTDLGARRHNESEAQFCERRGRESEARWAKQDAAMREAHAERERLGIPHPETATAYTRDRDRLGFWEYGR